jgi:hypothetical protein
MKKECPASKDPLVHTERRDFTELIKNKALPLPLVSYAVVQLLLKLARLDIRNIMNTLQNQQHSVSPSE